MQADAAARVVDAAWGSAYLSPAIERTYDRNLLWVAGDGAGLAAATLDGHAERLLGGAGMTHRRIVAEPAADARLRPGMTALGYEAGTHLFQIFPPGGRAPEPVAGVEVAEAPVDDVLAGAEEYLKTDPDAPYGRDPRTRAHLLEHYRGYGPAGADERRFVVREDGRRGHGRVVAWARLWTRAGGDEAQVEDVVVLAPHRGRGYGRAIVAAATRAALQASPSLLFIVADADDWPKALYERLGYATAGRLGVYLRFAPR
ncbi:MAG TPA: GNAT family N-acetyltransferase [Baekduia sp.]|uniref:GNAT family N-acetyltransferase n=1 Tax=Baekduia sp. TaxID=2600305 RepID=UPI002D7A283C|nr:GNAT family N-acetyltransferase [Baekduia sp.]HET6510521.1 GNAT family N-acetyltransferase [Baekduia sp.]